MEMELDPEMETEMEPEMEIEPTCCCTFVLMAGSWVFDGGGGRGWR
jgi:hypothetical protein